MHEFGRLPGRVAEGPRAQGDRARARRRRPRLQGRRDRVLVERPRRGPAGAGADPRPERSARRRDRGRPGRSTSRMRAPAPRPRSRRPSMAIRAGAARVALAVGFEKMFVGDTGRSLDALESAADLEVIAGLGLQFTAIYAMRVRRRIDAGALEHRHLLDVAVKSHDNGALNPYAQYRKRFTREEVEASAPIAEPLTLLMCSSISDGAAAAVLVAGDHPAATRHPKVVVRAIGARIRIRARRRRRSLDHHPVRAAGVRAGRGRARGPRRRRGPRRDGARRAPLLRAARSVRGGRRRRAARLAARRTSADACR